MIARALLPSIVHPVLLALLAATGLLLPALPLLALRLAWLLATNPITVR